MDRRLLQILDNTACLSKTQLEGYINNNLQPEELYAVEMHLIECPICNDAVEGFIKEGNINTFSSQLPLSLKLPPHKKEKKIAEAKNVVTTSHSNTAGSSHTKQYDERKPVKPFNLLKPIGIAAVLIAGFVLLWHYQLSKPSIDKAIAARMDNEVSDSDNGNSDRPTTQNQPAPNGPITTPQNDTAKTVINKRADTASRTASPSITATTAGSPATIAANPAKDGNTVPDADAASKKNIATRKEENKPAVTPEDSDNISAAREYAADASSDATIKRRKPEADNAPQTDYEKGLSLYHQQDYGSAILYFRTVMKDDSNPKLYSAMYYCAMSYKSMGNRRKAVKLFKELVKSDAPQKSSAQKQLDAME